MGTLPVKGKGSGKRRLGNGLLVAAGAGRYDLGVMIEPEVW